jgi:hypothetical protein
MIEALFMIDGSKEDVTDDDDGAAAVDEASGNVDEAVPLMDDWDYDDDDAVVDEASGNGNIVEAVLLLDATDYHVYHLQILCRTAR